MEVKGSSIRSYQPDKKRRLCRRESWEAVRKDLSCLSKLLDEMIQREVGRSALREMEA